MRASLTSANPLDYSQLPARSRLVCEIDDESLRIYLPPVSTFTMIAGIAIAGASLLLCTIALAITIVHVATNPQADAARDTLGMLQVYVGFPITLLCLWAAAIVAGRTLRRRIRTPTSISVFDDELVLITPNEFTLRRDWPAGSIEKIEARPLGRSMTMHRIGELCIVPLGEKCASVLRGQDLRELQWVAGQLSRRLELNSV